MPFPWDLNSFDEVPDQLLLRDQSLFLQIRDVRRAPRVQPFRRVRLEFDRVRSGLGGNLDEPERRGEVAVVVRSRLGDDVAGVPGADRAVADDELGIARRLARSPATVSRAVGANHEFSAGSRHAPR